MSKTTDYTEEEMRNALQIAIDVGVTEASNETGMPVRTIHNYLNKLRQGTPIRGVGRRAGMLTYITLKGDQVQVSSIVRHALDGDFNIGVTRLPKEKLEREIERLKRKHEKDVEELTKRIDNLYDIVRMQGVMLNNRRPEYAEFDSE